MFDFDNAFFSIAWRRYLVVAVCIGWGLFELLSGAVFWAVIFIGFGILTFWQFSQINWRKYHDEEDT